MSSEPVDLSVLPIDVGFDLRIQGMPVIVPTSTASAAYDMDGSEQIVRGTVDEVAAALRSAGYEVVIEASP